MFLNKANTVKLLFSMLTAKTRVGQWHVVGCRLGLVKREERAIRHRNGLLQSPYLDHRSCTTSPTTGWLARSVKPLVMALLTAPLAAFSAVN